MEANRRIQRLEKKLNDGALSRKAAQKEIDDLTKALAAARRKPEAKQDRDGLKDLKDDIADLKSALKSMPRGGGGGGQAPIVVQGGSGGGGASSSAGGSSASSGGGGSGAAPRAAAPDLSKVVEAVKQIAGAAKKKGGGGTKGITQARRTYTDKRKAKIAELRALKAKRIREFAAKTKKLPKAERLKQRREYKKKVEAQFKEMQTRFPTARGLKSVGVIRELIRKMIRQNAQEAIRKQEQEQEAKKQAAKKQAARPADAASVQARQEKQGATPSEEAQASRLGDPRAPQTDERGGRAQQLLVASGSQDRGEYRCEPVQL